MTDAPRRTEVVQEGHFDICIVGAGLVGLGVGRALLDRLAGSSVLVLEKEPGVGRHQSGHNSGVLHSGLYYKPGSLKARLCVEGRRSMREFCEAEGIAVRDAGKLVIATSTSQFPALDELERRGRANGLVGLRRLSAGEITDVEPAATGMSALHIPEAGVVDFPTVAEHLAAALERLGARVVTGAEVTRITHGTQGVSVETTAGDFSARVLVNCAGLYSDRVAGLAGLEPDVRIVPFRGEYYRLSDQAAALVRGLIYPVPDPRFPFLGVHFTRRVDDIVEVGPNAVLALGREHYRGVGADWGELRSVLAFPGFRRLARRHLVSGASELLNSRSTRLYARLARRLVPDLRASDLLPGGAGVRAQAVDTAGKLVDDFVIEEAGRSVHVLNAPSPGATASLAIGRFVAERVAAVLQQ